MDIEKLIEDLRGLLKQYGEKIPYGELVGAPWPYSRAGDLVWQDPEPYFIEQAATALSTLQAENEKLRDKIEDARLEGYAKGLGEMSEENERLWAELEQIPSCIYYKQGGLCRYGGDDPANVCVLGPCDHDVSVQDVLTELEQIKAERDAAVSDLETIMAYNSDTCQFCKNGQCYVRGGTKSCLPKWRGQKEE